MADACLLATMKDFDKYQRLAQLVSEVIVRKIAFLHTSNMYDPDRIRQNAPIWLKMYGTIYAQPIYIVC